jgi:hypothetical protein
MNIRLTSTVYKSNPTPQSWKCTHQQQLKMALSTCNLVANPSFESGNLFPWFPSALNAAKISNATGAYDGDYYLYVLIQQ